MPARSPHRRWLLAGLLALGSADATEFHVDEQGLSAAQVQATHDLLQAALDLLPPRWRQSLPARLDVQWRELRGQVQARALSRSLVLDRELLQSWSGGDRRPDGDGRAPLAAVVHELAHFHDRSPQGGLSRDPQLLDQAGWLRGRWRRAGANTLSDRSPDDYERHSPAEFVAVNLEYFVLDPQYRCRRPQLHGYFAAHFGMPAQTDGCPPTLPFVQAGSDDGQALLQLDPERIHAVDYLLAEPDPGQPMSRWGHSMLRLVICAPGRPRGPDCRLDLREHRVISFRAFVDDVQVSSWRGLTGDYPSRLYVLPLQQVVDEYTRVELRGLHSLPLRLERGEIAAVARRAAQLHWSYDGRYYFLGNNCALETWRLLHDASPRLAALPLASIRPNVLLRRLQRAGIADASVLDDPARARRLGYRFDSASDDYEAMFRVVRGALPVEQGDARRWLAAAPARRGQWIERADLRTSAAMLLLEQAAWQRQQARMREVLKRRLLRGGGHDAMAAAFRQVLEQEGMLAQPAALLQAPGYGLPQPAELASADAAPRARQVRDGWNALRAQASETLPASERALLAGIDANLEAIGRHLRRLHAESGGLALPDGL